MVARRALAPYSHVLVLSGDVPRVRVETMARLRAFHLAQSAAMTILTAEPPDPAAYGRVIRSYGDEVSAIVEARALTPEQQHAREINSGIYAFAVAPLFRHIRRLSTANYHREFYLTDMAAILAAAGERVVALRAESSEEVLGANTRAELVELDALLRREKCARLMESGVTIFQPETCVIDSEVEIAPDTVVEPFVQILGKTRIGSDCRIRSYSVISDCEIESGVTIRPGCILDQSRVRRGAILGPYSHLRPGTDVGEGAHVGNFVETKKARLGRKSQASHLTYIGDAEVGERVNFGCGTITCNYDGVHKHQTTIGDDVFIGSDVQFVAPVTIGSGSLIGAGSTITRDVPPDALALSRAEQKVIEGWAARKRAKQKKQG
jgi:bifunctional UDP-N-acetylglucosamine pyrophosphorylase/glucosamine-1-phosphate N-acetyltransferase